MYICVHCGEPEPLALADKTDWWLKHTSLPHRFWHWFIK